MKTLILISQYNNRVYVYIGKPLSTCKGVSTLDCFELHRSGSICFIANWIELRFGSNCNNFKLKDVDRKDQCTGGGHGGAGGGMGGG